MEKKTWFDRPDNDDHATCTQCKISKAQLQTREVAMVTVQWVQRCGPEEGVILSEIDNGERTDIILSLCYSCYSEKFGADALASLVITGWRDEMIGPPSDLPEEMEAWRKRKETYDEEQEMRFLQRLLPDMYEEPGVVTTP